MYQLDRLENIVSDDAIQNLRNFLRTNKWNYKIPGGFLTNFPQRRVNTYGNGQYVNNNGILCGHKWDSTYWTAKQTQNNVSLETSTEPLPDELCKIVPFLRDYLKQKSPNNKINDYTFNIAVCNNYTDPSMNIAGHTDDDYWYPCEVDERPIFVSLTFYLDGTPIEDKYYSRFQLKLDDKWTDIKLDDNSVLFMNSDIPHRVMKHKKKDMPYFKPRINITLRSTYNIKKNPLLHNICVANHSRYYKIPKSIISDGTVEEEKIDDLLEKYNEFCRNNKADMIVHKISELHKNKKKYVELYKKYVKKYNLDVIKSYKSNIVIESLIYVCEYIDNNL